MHTSLVFSLMLTHFTCGKKQLRIVNWNKFKGVISFMWSSMLSVLFFPFVQNKIQLRLNSKGMDKMAIVYITPNLQDCKYTIVWDNFVGNTV